MFVYAEEVFIVNFVMDYILTYFVCTLKNHKKTKLKCFICAFMGGVYGVYSLYLYTNILHKIIICLAMGYVIDNSCLYETVMSSILMLLGSFICAGSITALSHITSSQYLFSTEINYVIVIVGSLAGMYIFNKCILTIYRSADIRENILHAKISLYDTQTCIHLLNDSGNLLKTSTGRSVIIVDESIFSILCPEVNTDSIFDDPDRVIRILPEDLQKRAGIITAESITGKQKMLFLKIDDITLYGNIDLKISPAYVAFAHINDERFSGIINMNFISKEKHNDKKNF